MESNAKIWLDIDGEVRSLAAMIDLAIQIDCDEYQPNAISDFGPTLPCILQDPHRRAHEIMEKVKKHEDEPAA